MLLTLDRDLFDAQSAAEATALVQLLSTVARASHHPHSVIIDPPYFPGWDNGPVDGWLDSRSSVEAGVFRNVLMQGPLIAATGPRGEAASDSKDPRRWHLSGPLTVRVERRSESDWRNRELTLADTADLLREPLHLLLENSRTEPAFLRYLAGATNGPILQALMDQPGRVMTHGGGSGEVKRRIDELTRDPLSPARWRRMSHCSGFVSCASSTRMWSTPRSSL